MKDVLVALLIRSWWLTDGTTIGAPATPLWEGADKVKQKSHDHLDQAKALEKKAGAAGTDVEKLRDLSAEIKKDKVSFGSAANEKYVKDELAAADAILKKPNPTADEKKTAAAKLKNVANLESALLDHAAGVERGQWEARKYPKEYEVKKGDTLYDVAKSRLEQAGYDNPSKEQILDYEKRIAAANDKTIVTEQSSKYEETSGAGGVKGKTTYELNVKKFPQPGQKITLPPVG
jgi:hypothetical protein